MSVAFFVGVVTAHAADFSEGVRAYEHNDYATALRIFRQFAAQGDVTAQNRLGAMYSKGEGVPQDYGEAVKWYHKAADQVHSFAQNNLGVMYGNGQGVAQDYGEAMRWYRKAADQGYALAQFNLGVMYGNGQGVPQDYIQAHLWYNLAAGQGEELGRKARESLLDLMTAEQIAEAQKLAREWKPKGKLEVP